MQRVEDEAFVLWLNGNHVFSIRNDHLPNGNLICQAHGFPQDAKALLCHRAVGSYVIWSVEVDGVDLNGIDELNEINGFGSFELDFLQVCLVDNDVPILLELVALDDVLFLNLAMFWAHHLLA